MFDGFSSGHVYFFIVQASFARLCFFKSKITIVTGHDSCGQCKGWTFVKHNNHDESSVCAILYLQKQKCGVVPSGENPIFDDRYWPINCSNS
jgi:hypothetical protein